MRMKAKEVRLKILKLISPIQKVIVGEVDLKRSKNHDLTGYLVIKKGSGATCFSCFTVELTPHAVQSTWQNVR
jgi:hypothetical protein